MALSSSWLNSIQPGLRSGGGSTSGENYWSPTKGLPFPGAMLTYQPPTPRMMASTPSYSSVQPSAPAPMRMPDLSGLYASMNQGAPPGPMLDPQQVEVAPPEMPSVARSGLMSASASSGAGWKEQPVQQLDSSNLGKRIYPPGGTALTQRGRVF